MWSIYLFGPFTISVVSLFSGQLVGRKPAMIRLMKNTIDVSEYAPKKKCRDIICSRFWYIRVCHSCLNVHREDKGISQSCPVKGIKSCKPEFHKWKTLALTSQNL